MDDWLKKLEAEGYTACEEYRGWTILLRFEWYSAFKENSEKAFESRSREAVRRMIDKEIGFDND